MGTRTWITSFAAVAAATAVLAAAPAQAGTSINLSIGTPGYYNPQPSYVYTEPSYVYSQPSYVYSQPSYVYSQPGYVVVEPRHRYRHHGWRRDRDHDGVPDRFDRRPNNPYRY
jgi:hypothetical protein